MSGLDALARQLRDKQRECQARMRAALAQAGQVIEEEARQRLEAMAALPGADAALADISAGLTHRVGDSEVVVSCPRAAVLERGTALAPPQPFLAPALLASRERVAEILGRAVLGEMAGGIAAGAEE